MRKLKWILGGVALTPLLLLYGCIGMGGQSGFDIDMSIVDNPIIQIMIGVGILYLLFRGTRK